MQNCQSNRMTRIVIYALLGIVALIMTVINVFTDKGTLTLVTGLFALFCLVNIILTQFKGKFEIAAEALFAIQFLAMFTYFLISGQPDGFSAIWICLLPTVGMFFFGRKKGAIVSGVMLLILIVLLWIPAGRHLLRYSYTSTFKMRFPLLYGAFFGVSVMLAAIREHAFVQMEEAQEKYRLISVHDQLTGLFNRHGLYATLKNNFTIEDWLGVVMLDIDFFKKINDTYGHEIGDEVLRGVSEIIRSNVDGVVCRWGGEEFVIIYRKNRMNAVSLESLRLRIANYRFQTPEGEQQLTVSMGVYEGGYDQQKGVDAYINLADEALYEAKQTGRNKIVHYRKPVAAAT